MMHKLPPFLSDQAIERPSSQRQSRTEMLYNLALGMGAETREDFWQALVAYLSSALQVDYVLVGTLQRDDTEQMATRLLTLAAYGNQQAIDHFEYDLTGGPCEDMSAQHACVHCQGVQARFPQDRLLQDFQIEGYMGLPLQNAAGNVIGLLVVMSCQPLQETAFMEEILSIFAARASTELAQQEAETKRDRFFSLSPDIFCIIDLEGGLRTFNSSLERVLGYSTAELASRTVFDLLHPEDKAAAVVEIERLRSGGIDTINYENRYHGKDGAYRRLLWSAAYEPQQQLIYATAQDITELKQMGKALQTKVKQQATIAMLGQVASSADTVQHLMDEVVARVAQTLGLKYCKVLELLPDKKSLLLKAGVGWQPGLVGVVELSASDNDSQASYTLQSNHPVVVTDLRAETRFSGPALLTEHNVISGMSVIIRGSHGPYGILGAHSTHRRLFSEEDTDFLQSIANLLAQKIEQAQAEQVLRQSEAVLRSFFDSAPLMMGVVKLIDNDIVHLSDNAVTAALFGLTPEAMRNQRASDLGVPPEVLQMWIKYYREAARTQQAVRFEYSHPTDGGETWLAATVSTIQPKDSTQLRFAYVVEDITQRKQNEAQLHEQAALLDVTNDAILVHSMEGKILFWNKGAETLYGWKGEEALLKNVNQLLWPEDNNNTEILQRLIQQGIWQGERPSITQCGQVITVMSRWSLMQDDQGNPTSILIVNTDITEQKQLEAQFLRTQRLESLGTLASGIAHDLNNILTPILGVAQLLPMQMPELSDKIKEELDILKSSAQRGSEIIGQVLSFARGVEDDLAPLSIQTLVSEVRSFADKTFPKSLDISVDIPRELWSVNGNVTKLHQMFINLFVNARDAMPQGGCLSISAANLFLDQTFVKRHLDAKAGPHVMVTVTDTGVGISPEHLDRIFEPFFTTKQSLGGTGLGLSTVHGIVHSHGGFMTAYSEVGKGAQFKIYLPAIESAVEPISEECSESLRGRDEIVLVVDDEEPILEVTRRILEAHDYQVMTAVDGIDAIAQYTQHQADIAVVLMDITMPNLDGATAIQIMQRINSELKVIVTSGLPNHEQVTSTIGNSVKTFLQKPYTPATLLVTVYNILRYDQTT